MQQILIKIQEYFSHRNHETYFLIFNSSTTRVTITNRIPTTNGAASGNKDASVTSEKEMPYISFIDK